MSMLTQIKNLLLHDIQPQEELLSRPGLYLKKVLLEDVRDYRSSCGVGLGYLERVGQLSFYSTPSSSSGDLRASTSTTSTSGSKCSILDVVDDGHQLGLGNPKILQLIMAHLSIPELLRMRLVNLRWNVIACATLRSKLDLVKIRPSLMKQFTKLMKRNITNPFASYTIRVDNLFDNQLQSFFKLVMVDIVRLRVRLQITELPEFAKMIQKMVNLKELHVMVFDDLQPHNSYKLLVASNNAINNNNNGSFMNLTFCDERRAWKMGLYDFPKLRSLNFENCDPAYTINPIYDLVVSNIIMASRNLRMFQFREWNSPLGKIFSKLGIVNPGVVNTIGKSVTSEELTFLFFNTNLRFQHLRLEVTPKEISFDLVSDIIHNCSGSLRELCLLNENIFDRFVVTTVFRNLVKLRLSLWWGAIDFSYFSRQFPTLQWLSLNLSNLYEIDSGKVDWLKFPHAGH